MVKSSLPTEFVDSHHHFLDTGSNKFQSFLGSLVPNDRYLPDHYDRDVVQELANKGTKVVGSVHVECMPDNGLEEAQWVRNMTNSTVKAIVASCDLTTSDCDETLASLVASNDSQIPVRGIRWILDCVGKFEPDTPTHVGTTRHDGIDYLRGSNGGYDGDVVPEFKRGFALLEKHGLSFDLQCAPAQLPAAASLFEKYPNIPICIDHLAKPRMLLGPDDSSNTNVDPNEEELRVWRKGIRLMADLPHVHIKLSMLGYAIPGWIRTPERVSVMKQLVKETIDAFSPRRCMVALNWWKSGAISDADGMSEVGPDPVQFLELMDSFFEGYSEEDKKWMFSDTAKKFYRF